MNITKKAIILICIFILTFISTSLFHSVLGVTASERQELIDLLNEYKGDLGNLNEFKEVVDITYNDLYSATTVDDTLKEKLREDIDLLDNVTDLNPLILTVLKVELNSQVDNLTDSNLEEMQEEISIIKEWTDEQLGISNTDTPNNNNDNNNNDDTNIDNVPNTNEEQQNNDSDNQNTPITYQSQNMNQATTSLPYTGTSSILIGFIILLSISMVVSIIRYKQFKDVK